MHTDATKTFATNLYAALYTVLLLKLILPHFHQELFLATDHVVKRVLTHTQSLPSLVLRDTFAYTTLSLAPPKTSSMFSLVSNVIAFMLEKPNDSFLNVSANTYVTYDSTTTHLLLTTSLHPDKTSPNTYDVLLYDKTHETRKTADDLKDV